MLRAYVLTLVCFAVFGYLLRGAGEAGAAAAVALGLMVWVWAANRWQKG